MSTYTDQLLDRIDKVTEQRDQAKAAIQRMSDAHAEHRRVLTNDGSRPERVDTCHCLGCQMYRAALGEVTSQ
jgi:hypothetical protein